jgi:hypothetical protein
MCDDFFSKGKNIFDTGVFFFPNKQKLGISEILNYLCTLNYNKYG